MAIVLCFLVLPASAAERPSFQASRVATPPVIDGDLTDAAWQTAQEITGFTQHDPDDGKPATRKTVVKVVYDDNAVYFGAMMEDSKPVTSLLGRRDNNLESDWFRISLDPQQDRLTGAAFWVNPANVQVDMILYNDFYDDWSWDGVWESAAKIVTNGWIAEVRIPFSQLRFPDKEVQAWGINFARRIVSNQEVDYLVNTPKGAQGFVSRFADLTGIAGIKPERMFEIVPYGVARSDVHSGFDRSDPFLSGSEQRFDGGMDFKYGLSSNLTLTGTINPDFGQVEVDPAVVNLTQFETFFPEKRPFFTEGVQMFRYGSGPAYGRWGFNFSSPTFFYSRRIGRSPQGRAAAHYSDVPGETTILGAAKITGKFGKGWSVGVLDALTDRETGTFATETTRWRQPVEPMTNYFVARTAREYGKNSRVGALVTSVNRRLPSELTGLRESAYFAGVDGYTLFRDKSWLFEWLAAGTLVQGSTEAMTATQVNPARYYQRPDAGHVELDPTRTSLSGFGGRAMLAKQTGVWRYNVSAQTWSPGFELNDVGFMNRTDMTATSVVVHYVDEKVRKLTRERSIWVGKYQNWNHDGDLLANGVHGNTNVEFTNYWRAWSWFGGGTKKLDDRKTRGGPVVTSPGSVVVGGGFESDSRRKLSFVTEYEWFQTDDGGGSNFYWLSLNYRPTSALRVSLSPFFIRQRTFAQYVATRRDTSFTATYSNRYIFATLDQKTFDMGVRAEWTASSRLSFQLYLQPFVASGDYHDFKQLTRPRSDDYESIAPEQFAIGNPDFNFRSIRGNAVVRWEFRPGSALYVVWNENREDVVPIGDFQLRRDLSALPDAAARDVFLVKVSYWLPI